MKKCFSLFVCSSLSLFSLLLTGEHFRLHPFDSISVERLFFVKKEEGVSITAKAYSEEESKRYLQRDLLSRGYQPIQISIQNNSPRSFILKLDTLSQERVPPQEIARRVIRSALPRAVGYKLASFLFWPFFLPSALDSLHTMNTYRALKQDYQAKELREERIPPYATVNRILFIRTQAFEPAFPLKLVDIHTGEVIDYLTTACS